MEALEGLAALASLAGIAGITPAVSNKTNPSTLAASSQPPAVPSYSVGVSVTPAAGEASFSEAASHGFGSGSLEDAKRSSIPSYATIRDQMNGSNNTTGVNGGATQKQPPIESYVWPPRRDG